VRTSPGAGQAAATNAAPACVRVGVGMGVREGRLQLKRCARTHVGAHEDGLQPNPRVARTIGPSMVAVCVWLWLCRAAGSRACACPPRGSSATCRWASSWSRLWRWMRSGRGAWQWWGPLARCVCVCSCVLAFLCWCLARVRACLNVHAWVHAGEWRSVLWVGEVPASVGDRPALQRVYPDGGLYV